MARVYRTREGTVSALDTRTQLSTLGSESAPGPLLVPQGKTKLVRIVAAQCMNMAAATSYSALIRLEGPGLARRAGKFRAWCWWMLRLLQVVMVSILRSRLMLIFRLLRQTRFLFSGRCVERTSVQVSSSLLAYLSSSAIRWLLKF
jgi:hypothetical protein